VAIDDLQGPQHPELHRDHTLLSPVKRDHIYVTCAVDI
jgi:hypothetical protein